MGTNQMNELIGAVIVSTITGGSILAAVSVGFVVLYRTTKVVSFAQGAFTLIGAFVFQHFAADGYGFPVSLLLGLLAAVILGAGTYLVVFARMEGSDPFVSAMATIGLGTLLEAVAIMIWGSNAIIVPNVLPATSFTPVSGLTFQVGDLVVVGMTVVLFAVLVVWLHRSRIGLRMRAVADVPQLAAYAGVNVTGISTLAWTLASGAAAIGGVALVLGEQPLPTDVFAIGLSAFPAILLGGFDSIIGALVGGFVVAFAQALIVTYVGGNWQDVATYGLLLVVLLVRPQGLFGSAEVSRV
jgi:branched-chain amino acid transport system permease protein